MSEKVPRPDYYFHKKEDEQVGKHIRFSKVMFEALGKLESQWNETTQRTIILIVDKYLQENKEALVIKRPKEK